jgi:hypothetical protein
MPSVGRNQYPHERETLRALILNCGRSAMDISGV